MVDNATLRTLQPFQPQRHSYYEAARNPRLLLTIGRAPIKQLGEVSYDIVVLGALVCALAGVWHIGVITTPADLGRR